MSNQVLDQYSKDDVSLKGIIDFLIQSWRGIVGIALIVLFAAVGFLTVTPNQYEAIAQIQMAQFGIGRNNTNTVSNSNSANSSSNSLGVNVEDPNLLIARLKLATTYSAREFNACGLEQKKMPAETLIDLSRFSLIKGVGSVVELRVRAGKKEQAIKCAQALFENIRESQNLIIKPYIKEAEMLLKIHKVSLKESQAFIASADKSGVALSVAYLANRDEAKFLIYEISRLNTFIYSAEDRQAKLVSPIYASELPVYPQKNVTLVAALFAGFFIGLLFMLGRKSFRTNRTNIN